MLYGYYPGRIIEPRNYTYTVITPPAELPITVTDLKIQTRIDWDNSTHDTWLTNFILKPVVSFAERYTNLNFITRKYRTTRDYFDQFLEIRRAPFAEITLLQYENESGTIVTLSPNVDYYTVKRYPFSDIFPAPNTFFPNNLLSKKQNCVTIEFTAGYAATAAALPAEIADIKMAMLQHATFLYQNRGDCDESSNINAIPNAARDVYDRYKIIEISGASYYA